MPIRLRKLLGTFVLVLGLIAYALGVMRLAVALMPMPPLLEFAFYVAAGVLWVFPARALIRWMARPDEEDGDYLRRHH